MYEIIKNRNRGYKSHANWMMLERFNTELMVEVHFPPVDKRPIKPQEFQECDNNSLFTQERQNA